jgi:multiple sugar transport system substrate-binding protein
MSHVHIARLIRWVIFGALLYEGGDLLLFGPRPDPVVPPNRVIVHYWEKWPGKEGQAMRDIVDDFNTTVGKDKGIYVDFLSISNIEQKTLIATAAGVPPDVAGLYQKQTAQFAALGALEPLDQLAADHGITRDYYKHVFWDACKFRGRLYALISTPADVALHYNKRIFMENADKLRAAGCDPTRAPRTFAELDRYAAALDVRDANGHIARAGYAPSEPGWYLVQTPVWFNARLFDENTQQFTLTSPGCLAAIEWIKGYSAKLGAQALSDFHAAAGTFNSAQNPFLTGQVVMEQQGPWMANYIHMLNPAMDGVWNGKGKPPKSPMNAEDMLTEEQWQHASTEERASYCEWAVAPFPSVLSDTFTKPDEFADRGAAYCDFDTLVIPQGARHKLEAFEFIAFVNRQDEMEKLNALHCKFTPLAKTSPNFFKHHPNPYIDIFDRLAASPNASALPAIPTWPEAYDELNFMLQRVCLLQQEPAAALAQTQQRLQARLEQFKSRHSETHN